MKRTAVLSALALVAAASCSESFPREQAPPVPPARLQSRPANATCIARPNPLGRVRLQELWRGFEFPDAIVDRPDLGLVYVGESKGKVKVVDRATGAIGTALDLTDYVGKLYDTGLLGLAIHPTKPYAYVAVELPEDGSKDPKLAWHAELLRFDLADGGRSFDRASQKVILRIDRPTFWHTFCQLEFGPDGYLYVGHGDGGGNLVPGFLTDNPHTLLGKILRIDVDGGDPYAIPPDNPFASGPARPEVWASGFRNPWRFTFDRATGDLWNGDVGDTSFEEINRVEKGKDYGWPILEGEKCISPRVGCDRTGRTPPVYTYPHADGSSISGGYVYRGSAMPDLVGKYVFADYVVGRIWALEGTGAETKAVLLNPGGVKPMVTTFGEDADGELYVVDWREGVVYKMVPGEPGSGPILPERLSETGCVDPADPKKPAPGLLPYDVNVELWSDGADKKRFVAIPDGTTIHVEDDGDLTLPDGSILVKEFSLNGRRIETRLLYKHPGNEWSGASYEWNDAQTDAVRLEGGKDEVLPNGQTWTFPSPAQCFICHTKLPKVTLGLESIQLNRRFEYGPGDVANQLTKLSELGMLDRSVDPKTAGRLPELSGAAPIEDRARAYLHANCSMCHRKGSGINARMDLVWGMPRAAVEGCAPSPFDTVPDAKILVPGEPRRSALYLRMTDPDVYRMPPLGTHVIDPVGSSLVEQWILSTESCE